MKTDKPTIRLSETQLQGVKIPVMPSMSDRETLDVVARLLTLSEKAEDYGFRARGQALALIVSQAKEQRRTKK